MKIPSKTKKGHITSRTTTYVHGDESYVIDVSDTSVSFTIFHKDVKMQEFSWKTDFAIEVALIILKGMNRELLIKTLISLQDFHPGSFVVPGDFVEEDYASMEARALAGLDSESGIPLEDITPGEMGSAYDEGFRIARSTPFFSSYADWSRSSGVNASEEFQEGFARGMCGTWMVASPPAPMQDVANLETGEELGEGKAKIRAVLDVLYDLADVPVTELQENLEKGIAHLFSIGAITLDSAAEVEEWSCKTHVNPGVKTRFSTEDIKTSSWDLSIDHAGKVTGTPTRVAVGGPITEDIEVPQSIRDALHAKTLPVDYEYLSGGIRAGSTPHPAGQTPAESPQATKTQQVIQWINRVDHTGMMRVYNALIHARHTTPDLIELRTLWSGACDEKKPSSE